MSWPALVAFEPGCPSCALQPGFRPELQCQLSWLSSVLSVDGSTSVYSVSLENKSWSLGDVSNRKNKGKAEKALQQRNREIHS